MTSFAFPLGEKVKIPAALIAGILSLLLAKSGILFFLFLIPLGFVCFRYGGDTSWAALVIALVLNLLYTIITSIVLQIPAGPAFSNFAFFAVIAVLFTWINSPRFIVIPGVWRVICASVILTVVFSLMFVREMRDERMNEILLTQVVEITSLYLSSAPDMAQTALLQALSPEAILDTVVGMVFRGAALLFSVFIFWISREAGLFFARIVSRFGKKTAPIYSPPPLKYFYTHPKLIWFFSGSLTLIIILSFINSRNGGSGTPLDIILWNILVLCAMLYLAQGLGIMQHFITRPAFPPFLRLVLGVGFIILLFSPTVNVALIGMVILLGIAETWISFRKFGAPSTPSA